MQSGLSERRAAMVFRPSPDPSRVVEVIETGAEAEVVIARNGRPVARLASLQAPARLRRLGIARWQFVVPDSIDGANPLITDLCERG
ncbi:type II toxin-antitoxin system Phd/YefM family antitoxin [Cyanobium sp. BA20m-p-22]|uniref:type II toxin-antitoxin system Phd/YefM family antitoxin n=1 Tax=Cyanobium sp. BA20m-p-22 TaxID=2823704 RepID=UPI0020CFE545|nr:prevent-host-death protein [Cyanobium sp. BA20m-p-22]